MNIYFFKVFGLGAACDLATICEDADPAMWQWTYLHFKIYLGPVMVTGGFRVTPKREC